MLQNRLTTDEIFEWCSIPWQELEGRDLKAKLEVFPEKHDMMVAIGNMMADEVIAHNKAGLPTKWVLPAGPTDEYASTRSASTARTSGSYTWTSSSTGKAAPIPWAIPTRASREP